jgi:hypothetical protein
MPSNDVRFRGSLVGQCTREKAPREPGPIDGGTEKESRLVDR